jgi:mono/diheme cytochrome c family protein
MLVAFSLEGGASLPVQPDPVVPVPIEDDFEVDAEMATAGAAFFGQRCNLCHGPGSVSGGLAPDLRASRIISSLERFASVVRDGRRADDGMPAYRDITFDELVSLQHYIRDRAEAGLAAGGGGG